EVGVQAGQEAAQVGEIGGVPAVEDGAELGLALRAHRLVAFSADGGEAEQAGAAVVRVTDALDQAEVLQLGDAAADGRLVEAEDLGDLGGPYAGAVAGPHLDLRDQRVPGGVHLRVNPPRQPERGRARTAEQRG